ncbi:hypothetical protein GJ496_002617 [Pomphorhynchus laevis]|nr:hypothetical protein GJ496_009193 [Pomphorhynchus laevis]KAI0986971.1 hypothetical protein GJ496_002617 [Pomphorhynchus laevis]
MIVGVKMRRGNSSIIVVCYIICLIATYLIADSSPMYYQVSNQTLPVQFVFSFNICSGVNEHLFRFVPSTQLNISVTYLINKLEASIRTFDNRIGYVRKTIKKCEFHDLELDIFQTRVKITLDGKLWKVIDFLAFEVDRNWMIYIGDDQKLNGSDTSIILFNGFPNYVQRRFQPYHQKQSLDKADYHEFKRNVNFKERYKMPSNFDCGSNGVYSLENDNCLCFFGWTGQQCESKILNIQCDRNPCFNGGKCIASKESLNFTCKCQENYSGRLCENQKLSCTNLRCEENEICVSLYADRSVCKCKPGYAGSPCKLKDTCAGVKCLNNGLCIPFSDGTYYCKCKDCFIGRHCETPYADYPLYSDRFDDILEADNEIGSYSCSRHNCFNDGVCNKIEGGVTCQCPLGYYGTRCELDMNECELYPCENGNCVNTNGSYFCSCYPGYTGKLCQHRINYCSPATCFNGGQCYSSNEGRHCICKPGFYGDRCEWTQFDMINSTDDTTTTLGNANKNWLNLAADSERKSSKSVLRRIELISPRFEPEMVDKIANMKCYRSAVAMLTLTEIDTINYSTLISMYNVSGNNNTSKKDLIIPLVHDLRQLSCFIFLRDKYWKSPRQILTINKQIDVYINKDNEFGLNLTAIKNDGDSILNSFINIDGSVPVNKFYNFKIKFRSFRIMEIHFLGQMMMMSLSTSNSITNNFITLTYDDLIRDVVLTYVNDREPILITNYDPQNDSSGSINSDLLTNSTNKEELSYILFDNFLPDIDLHLKPMQKNLEMSDNLIIWDNNSLINYKFSRDSEGFLSLQRLIDMDFLNSSNVLIDLDLTRCVMLNSNNLKHFVDKCMYALFAHWIKSQSSRASESILNDIHQCHNLNMSGPIEIKTIYLKETTPGKLIVNYCHNNNICNNNGKCIHDKNSTFKCLCEEGFMGKYCEFQDPCIFNPCSGYGSCSAFFIDGKKYPIFECQCDQGFFGPFCQHNICQPNPCQNEGICDQHAEQLCHCPLGTDGQFCEYNLCQLNPCLNNGRCEIDSSNSVHCSCSDQYTGKHCEIHLEEDICMRGQRQFNDTLMQCVCLQGPLNVTTVYNISADDCNLNDNADWKNAYIKSIMGQEDNCMFQGDQAKTNNEISTSGDITNTQLNQNGFKVILWPMIIILVILTTIVLILMIKIVRDRQSKSTYYPSSIEFDKRFAFSNPNIRDCFVNEETINQPERLI